MRAGGPEVSVIMANYDGAAHIAAAVQSVLGQTLSDLELILVDDASTDGSLALAEAAAGGDPRLVVLRQAQNAGPAAARNRGLAAARGRWIAIVDSDDVLEPHRLRFLIDAAHVDGAEVVADNLLVFSDQEAFEPHPLLSARDVPGPCWIGLKALAAASRMYARGPDLGYVKPVIARPALERAGGGYDERLRIGEDYDLLARLLAAGARMRLYPDTLYHYRKHEHSLSHRLKPEHLRDMLDAHAAFMTRADGLDRGSRTALKARGRSLERALVYDEIIEGLKAGRTTQSLATGLANPGVWPLLTMPVKARLQRLATRASRTTAAA